MTGIPDAHHLFVYGTLRSASGHPMRHLLARRADLVGPASVPARLLDLGAYPGAVADVDGARVVGELWRLHDADAALPELDAYEGCGPRDDPPHDFRRARVDARLDDGPVVSSWIYWYDGDLGGARVASGDWRPRV